MKSKIEDRRWKMAWARNLKVAATAAATALGLAAALYQAQGQIVYPNGGGGGGGGGVVVSSNFQSGVVYTNTSNNPFYVSATATLTLGGGGAGRAELELQTSTNGGAFAAVASGSIYINGSSGYYLSNNVPVGGVISNGWAFVFTNTSSAGGVPTVTIFPGSGTISQVGSTVTTTIVVTNATTAGTATNGAVGGNIVTNNPVFYPESYGATGNGKLDGSGNDDTIAIQSAINAAELVSGKVKLSSKYYKITSALLVTNVLTIEGVGCSGIAGSYTTNASPDFDTYNIPTIAPFLVGSVIIQTNATDIIVCSNLARAFNAFDFGLMFATNLNIAFRTAGYGIRCTPPPLITPLATNYDNGIMGSNWKGLMCWGSGSNAYAFYLMNGGYNYFQHLESFACGGFEYESDGPGTYNLGNQTMVESDFYACSWSTNPVIWLRADGANNPGHYMLQRVQALMYNPNQLSYTSGYNTVAPSAFSTGNPQNTLRVDGTPGSGYFFVTVDRCAFENTFGQGGPVVWPDIDGSMVWMSSSVSPSSFPNVSMDNSVFNTVTPTLLPDGISFGLNAQSSGSHKELIRLLDYDVSGAQYLHGIGEPDNYGPDNYIAPNTSTYHWTWSGWTTAHGSGLQTRTVLAAIQAGTGNFTNAGSITAGNGFTGNGSGLTNLPAVATISASNFTNQFTTATVYSNSYYPHAWIQGTIWLGAVTATAAQIILTETNWCGSSVTNMQIWTSGLGINETNSTVFCLGPINQYGSFKFTVISGNAWITNTMWSGGF